MRIIRHFLSGFLILGLLAPSLAFALEAPQDEKSLQRDVKKIALLAGELALIAAGLAVTGIGAYSTYGAWKFDAITSDERKRERDENRDLKWHKRWLKELKVFAHRNYGTSPIEASTYTGALTGIGLLMTAAGSYALKHTKIEDMTMAKQKIKKALNIWLDISKLYSRGFGYGMSTLVGLGGLGVSVGLLAHPLLQKKPLSREHKRMMLGSVTALPFTTAMLILGIKGLLKEYDGWKTSSSHDAVMDAIQSIKNKIKDKVNCVVDYFQ